MPIPSISCSFDKILAQVRNLPGNLGVLNWGELGMAFGMPCFFQQKPPHLPKCGGRKVETAAGLRAFDGLVVSAEIYPLSEGADFLGET